MSYTVPVTRTTLLWCATLITSVATVACESPKPQPADDPAAADQTTQQPAAPVITDAQIAHIVVTANSIDSSLAELAKTRAQSSSVKDFAQTMITDHGAVNRQAVQLAQRLKVTPESNEVSRQLQQAAEEARAGLESKSGAEFDRAYIQREVEYHQAVADALDNTLIPGAQNPELKALLESARPAFGAHLDRARRIQGTLEKS